MTGVRANLSQVQNVLVEPFATAVQSLASVEVVKRNELHTFVVLPKRWVVERSRGWQVPPPLEAARESSVCKSPSRC